MNRAIWMQRDLGTLPAVHVAGITTENVCVFFINKLITRLKFRIVHAKVRQSVRPDLRVEIGNLWRIRSGKNLNVVPNL
jgi:hypothetical protein